VTSIRLGLGLKGHWLPFEIDHKTNSTLITLHLPPPRPNLLPRSQFHSCLIWTGQVAISIYSSWQTSRSPEIRLRCVGSPSKMTGYKFSYRKICASDINKVRVRVRRALAPLRNQPQNKKYLDYSSYATHEIKSPPPKSILAQFGPVKWQNLSTAPDKRVDHLRYAVVASAPLQNRPGTNFPIEKYKQVTSIRLRLGLERHWLPFKINHRTNSALITLHLPPPRPNLLPQSQFLPDLDRSSGKIYLQLLTNV
jgi:hypothetical protein